MGILQEKIPLNQGLVLCYHSIDVNPHSLSLDARTFEQQLSRLHNRGYRSITLNEMLVRLKSTRRPHERTVCITFDDGYQSFIDTAYPILSKYDFTATVFLPTDFVGGSNEWVKAGTNPRYDAVSPDMPIMNWKDICYLSKNGIHFESHTCSHPNLTLLEDWEVRAELLQSKLAIESRLSLKVEFLCYPYGFHNARVALLAKEVGYKGACTLWPGANATGQDPYSIRRCPLDSACFDPMLNFSIYTSLLCQPASLIKRGFNGITANGWL